MRHPFVGLRVAWAESGDAGLWWSSSPLLVSEAVSLSDRMSWQNPPARRTEPHMARSTPEQLACYQHRYRALAEAIADVGFIRQHDHFGR